MKKALWIALVLTFLVSSPTTWATSIGGEPVQWPGTKQAQILQAPNNLIALVGYQAQITAIRGNQITMRNLTDATKTATIRVDNTTLFKVGQQVNVTERLLTPR
jgi:hypothetical protein